ncbi:hypothetical protein G9F73_012450 [Clostridium estertheticum]|uniref:hypothetical protein n=1 Tax=Clostridium estertheticum TaxID=238834 RepID=UPI0013EEDD46|nr:hypothetical protein [Clostridium estertheticum]MBZ9608619.1 hypothetical protein [Clostridium estertheticum]
MKNINLIYNYILPIKVDIHKKPIRINLTGKIFNSETLVYLASRIKFLYGFKWIKGWKIIIELGNVEFADKITYLILDALLYDLLKNTRFNIGVSMSMDKKIIHHIGFVGTALYRAMYSNGLVDKKIFLKTYEKPFYSDTKVYRRLITHENLQMNNEWPSQVCTEVAAILKGYSAEEEWTDGISEVVSELLCNVSSHTDGDCLIDIDISDKVESERCHGDKTYLSVNIAVINFSENKLFDRIKHNLKENKYEGEDFLYNRIYKTYEIHKKVFDESYNEDDFFLVTAFQNHVSSRAYKSGMGGTGLTTLIEKIIGKTDDAYSYVLSGNNIIMFKPKYLTLSEDKFVGFNDKNDYFNFRPSKEVINKSSLYIPGSVYHLLLIKEC